MIRFTWILLSVLLLSACSEENTGQKKKGIRLERILKQGELVVVTRNAPTTYYEGRTGLSGFEYDLVNAYARHLGVKVRFIIKDSLSEFRPVMLNGEADIAAAGLTQTEGRADHVLFSVPYQQVRQQVICRRGGKRPKDVADLADVSLVVPELSSYQEQLIKLKQQYPELQWQTDAELSTENLLEKVWLKEIDCTVADSNIVDINRRYYPELTIRFDLSKPQSLVWIMPRDATRLQASVNRWMGDYLKSDDYVALIDKYYGFIEVFDYVDIRTFKRRIKSRLPKYRKLFEEAGQKYGIPWEALAAISYQESHWRANARSPTGVRGLMMLTLTTAKEMGVTSRLDPRQSVMGGARYLSRLARRLPESITGDDRLYITLAAYNVGMGHIWDARTLAKRLGKNPDLWLELKEVLPLLSQKKYYKTLKYGYARGREPVIYVRRIRDYVDILDRSLARQENKPVPGKQAGNPRHRDVPSKSTAIGG